MLASMKRQFAELLSDIGFVAEGLTVRDIERQGRGGGDGVLSATGPEVGDGTLWLSVIDCIWAGQFDTKVQYYIN